MRVQWGVWAMVAGGALGCGGDQLRKIPCVESQKGFDIEQVSVLEGAYSVPHGADAVILEADTSKVPADGVWRVGAVDVLIAIPEREFASYPKNVALSLQVWDDDKPTARAPWTVRQALDTSKLTWETVKLPNPDRPSGAPISFKRAWWTFDFTQAVPETGMTAKQYLVAARWDSDKLPLIGASNFNRPCNRNWSDYADGKGWVLNGRTSGNDCNWPMFRVGTEVITQRVTCD